MTSRISGSSVSNDMTLEPWILLSAVVVLGQQTSSNSPNNNNNLLDNFFSFVDTTLVPLYAALVTAYVMLLVGRVYILPLTSVGRKREAKSKLSKVGADDSAISVEDGEGADVPQPIDLSGKYKLVSLDNFDAFLEAQGVPWALRRAACRARPVHRITHKGNRITIRIEGIIKTQTTYLINGPPVEINIRGRIFQDRMQYLEGGVGLRGIKKAVTENYDVHVDRVLSDDKQKITLTGRAIFKDGRETIESLQIFERIE